VFLLPEKSNSDDMSRSLPSGSSSPLPNTLIFDLGNVIIPLRNERYWQEEVFDVLFDPEPLQTLREGGFFRYYEMGKFGDKAFLDKLEAHLLPGYQRQDIMAAWLALLDDLPLHRLDFIQLLSEQHQVLLLSNTNNLHLTYILDRYGREVLEGPFKKCYYSHLLGLAKPDPSIYQYVLKDQQIHATQALFLDDRPDNILSASKLGIQTILVTPGEEIAELLTT
jgi:glucose-1-phosphatase